MLLWNQDGPSQNGLGAALWGSVLCVRWSVASSCTSADSPWGSTACVQCQTVRQDTGRSDCPGHWPTLGSAGLAWWHGSPWSSRKLPLPLPRQEIENNPVLFLCLWCEGPLLAFLSKPSSSCFLLWDFGLDAKPPRPSLSFLC